MRAVNTDRDREIVSRVQAGERSIDLAREYGITRARVSLILHEQGTTAQHLCPTCQLVMTSTGRVCYPCGVRAARAARPKRVLLKDTHGQLMCYRNGCKCPQCLQANREHHAATIAKAPFKEHGTTTSYYTNGCRCDLCKQAASAYQRERRAARGR